MGYTIGLYARSAWIFIVMFIALVLPMFTFGCTSQYLPVSLRPEFAEKPWWIVYNKKGRSIYAAQFGYKKGKRIDGKLRHLLPEKVQAWPLQMLSISPSGRKWVVMAPKDLSDITTVKLYIINISKQESIPLDFGKISLDIDDSISRFSWSPDEKHLAAFITRNLHKDESCGPWSMELLIVDAQKGDIFAENELAIPKSNYPLFTSRPWLDNTRILLTFDSGNSREVLAYDIDSRQVKKYVNENQASVLGQDRNRVLLAKDSRWNRLAVVDAENPEKQLALLGGGGVFGETDQKQIDIGFLPAMSGRFLASPDGNWLLVRSEYLRGTPLGFPAPAYMHILQSTKDKDLCIKLRGVPRYLDFPQKAIWAYIPCEVTEAIGLTPRRETSP
jgi:hypothetical protein